MNSDILGQQNMFESGPLTVAKFVDLLNQRIKPLAVKIIGEVSEAKAGPTGHMYFSLKDDNGPPAGEARPMGGAAVLSCVIWRSRYEMFGIQLMPGAKIVASGHAEIYPPSGRLSFICDTIELAGEGALKKEYDRLLKLLTAQGLFEPTRKRPLPQYLRRIGVITSKQGAVIHDFLNNIGKFGFQIEFIDSRVEGQLAVADLLSSIKTFEKRKIDVLVIIRGGGSLEAMLAFNNEQVVRQIAGFPVPVICGIGHDKDVPLAAMAADIAVSTPTAAANLISESWRKIYQLLDNHQITLLGAYRNALNRIKARLYENTTIIANFKQLLQKIRLLMDKDISQMMADLNLKLAGARQLLDYAQSTINSNNPERQLMLGYSIARIGGKIIKKTAQAGIGEQLDISVSDGMIISKVESLDKKSGR